MPKNKQEQGHKTSKDRNSNVKKNVEPKPLGMYSMMAYLPCKIHLPLKKKYTFTINNKRYQACLIEKKRALTIIDINNEFLVDERKFRHEGFGVSKNLIPISDPHGDPAIFLSEEYGHMTLHNPYTVIVTDFEVTSTIGNHEMAEVALEYFIKCYQNISDDTLSFTPSENHINSYLKYCDLHSYTDLEKELTEDERFNSKFERKYQELNSTIKAYHMKSSGGMDKKEVQHDSKIELLFKAKTSNKFILSTLFKANTQLYPYKNYKYALLDFFFVIESTVQNHVVNKKIALGITQKEIDNYKMQIGISYMINVDMKILNQPLSNELKEILKELNAIKDLRNGVVHKEHTVSEPEAVRAKNATYKLLQYLKIPLFSVNIASQEIEKIPEGVAFTAIENGLQ